MTSLAAITFTLVGGIGMFTVTLGAFGSAVKNQSDIVASRCAARPPTVIYNPNPDHPCQQRGNNPMFGWILWVMRLSYDTLLQGVPGTGTRKGGLEGTLLKVNLDGIVLLRFHHLCLRISGVAVILYLFIMLPLYSSAACASIGEPDARNGFFSQDLNGREAYCHAAGGMQNLTDYQRLTLANIPTLHHASLANNVTWGSWFLSFFQAEHHGLLARLYAAVICSWIVTWYTMRELTQEWKEVLAMRRVYYLEADLWQERQEELERIGMDHEDDYYFKKATAATIMKDHESVAESPTKSKKGGIQLQRALYRPTNLVVGMSKQIMTTIKQQTPFVAESKTKSEESRTKRRDPWVPHPEQGDTVPNIGLYSILVGGLPTLPTAVRYNDEAIFSRKQSIDWQLSVATAFFDHCVPNQPGFSSSVAAVTVLPESSYLTEAWGKWYVAAAKLRRLRFIRRQIADLEEKQNGKASKTRQNFITRHQQKSKADVNTTNFNDSLGMIRGRGGRQRPREDGEDEEQGNKPNRRSQMKRAKSMYGIENDEEKKRYNMEILGSKTDLDVDTNLLNALDFGPEQSAVYSREFAQSSAALAPNGCCEERIRFATMDELIIMEQAAVEAVHEANEDLREVQEAILNDDDDFDDSIEDIPQVMGKASTHGRRPNDRRSVWSSSSDGSSDSEDSFARDSSFGDDDANDKAGEVAIDFGDDESKEKSGLLRNNEPSQQSFGNEDGNVLISTARTLTKQLTAGSKHLANMTGATNFGQNIANMANLGGQGRASAARRSDVKTAQLPDHLGLEAGLWMKSRSSTVGRNSTISRSGSADNLVERATLARSSSNGSSASHVERASLGRSSSNGSNPRYRRQSGVDSDRRSTQSTSYSTDSGPEDDIDVGSFWNQLERNARDISRARGVVDSIDEGIESIFSDWDGASETASTSNSLFGVGIVGMEDAERTPLTFSNKEDTMDRLGYGRGQPLEPMPRDEDIRESIAWQRSRLSTLTGQPMTGNGTGTGSDGKPRSSKSVKSSSDKSLRMSDVFQSDTSSKIQTGPRKRAVAKKTDRWSKVTTIVAESSTEKKSSMVPPVEISDGTWKVKTWQESFFLIFRQLFEVLTCVTSNTTEVVEHFDDLARDSTYAVVTFTSRQAAVAARHCLADSRGGGRWVTTKEIPIPPLADASPLNLTSFRGCMRPVTFTINDKQKLVRSQVATVCVFLLYFFYTIPLVAAQQLVEPEQLKFIFPDIEKWQESSEFIRTIFSGIIPALVWTGFFSLCPIIFKVIANFGSNATSLVDAENNALKSFWWFMVLAAFSGTSLSTAVIKGFSEGIKIGAELQTVVEVTARSIPTEVSATWLNWVIVRFTIVLPTQYLLQMNSYLFSMLGMQCCNRAGRGGGAGGPIPYRVYVDSGVVMLCLFALAPASPLIAPAVLVYFLICIPLFRWSMIFQYKPKFDIGGERFSFLFDMCVSGMLVGQILLAAMMSLKSAMGAALLAAFPIIPTIIFRLSTRKKYLRAFSDAALLQTSLLDGWDTNEGTSQRKREEFRQFLVDSHKAAYVPVCIAGDNSAPITTEPAVVVPLENDEDSPFNDLADDASIAPDEYNEIGLSIPQLFSPEAQPGSMMRRANNSSKRTSKPNSMRSLAQSIGDESEHRSFTMPLASESPSNSPTKENHRGASQILMSPTRKNAQRFVRARLPDSPAL